jgi:hypothetical protein
MSPFRSLDPLSTRQLFFSLRYACLGSSELTAGYCSHFYHHRSTSYLLCLQVGRESFHCRDDWFAPGFYVADVKVLFEFLNYGMSIAGYVLLLFMLTSRFVNLIYDFKFSAGGDLSMCMLDDLVNNPAPGIGCNSYQAAAAFCAVSW